MGRPKQRPDHGIDSTKAQILLALAMAARTGMQAPTYAEIGRALGILPVTVSNHVRGLIRAKKLVMLERRWRGFMQYDVVGIGRTGELPCREMSSGTQPRTKRRHARRPTAPPG